MYVNLRESAEFGAKEIDPRRPRPEWANSAPAINSALYHVWQNGGGTVYAPGNYYAEGRVYVPGNVNLVGTYLRTPMHGYHGSADVPALAGGGSHLYLEPGDQPESILMSWGSHLEGVTLVQVDQLDRSRVVPKAPLVRGYGASIRNVEPHICYDAFVLGGPSRIEGSWGQALNVGLRLDQGHAGHTVLDVGWPQCWTDYASEQGQYQLANGVMFHVAYSDGFNLVRCNGRGSRVFVLIDPIAIDGVTQLATGFMHLCGCEVEGPSSAALLLRGGKGNMPVNVGLSALNAEGWAVKTEKYEGIVNLTDCYHYGNRGKLASIDGGRVLMTRPSLIIDGDPAIRTYSGTLDVIGPVVAEGVKLRALVGQGSTFNLVDAGGNIDVVSVPAVPDVPLPVPMN